jgi:hypothetical protein
MNFYVITVKTKCTKNGTPMQNRRARREGNKFLSKNSQINYQLTTILKIYNLLQDSLVPAAFKMQKKKTFRFVSLLKV